MSKTRLDPNILNEPQKGYMRVHSKILKDLSSGIYSNPGNAIKELIINSYDADAKQVTVRAKPDLDSFTIIDDGIGMNCDDFDTKFVWISHSEKRKEREVTELFKRPLVGRFGIGFISASQLCNKMTVISSKKGEPRKFQAIIDFSQYKDHSDYEDPKDIYDVSEFDFINLEEDPDEHYTIIILSELSPEFVDILNDKEIEDKINEMNSSERKKNERIDLEDISFKDIVSRISEKNIDDLDKKIGSYWKFVLDIANTIPIPYLEGGPLKISHTDPILDNIINSLNEFNFTVDVDGILLKKPVLLPNKEDIITEDVDYNVYYFSEELVLNNNKLKFRGYIYNQKNQIKPVDFQGILIRIRNVAIGRPDPNFLDYPWSEKMYMSWTYGEIYVEEGLEDALNINRNSFSINNPHYMYIRKYLHDILHDEVFKKARSRYAKRKKESTASKEIIRKNDLSQIIVDVLDNDTSTIDSKNEVIQKKKPSSTKSQISYLTKKESIKTNISISSDDNCSDPVYIIDNESKDVVINDKHSIFKGHLKKDKEILEEFLVIYKTSEFKSGGDIKKFEKIFFKALENWRKK